MKLTPAQQKLAEDNTALVGWIIQRYFGNVPSLYSLSREELFQEGCLLLCHAAQTYQPDRAAFSTYAAKVVQNGLTNYLSKELRLKQRIAETSAEEDEPDALQSLPDGNAARQFAAAEFRSDLKAIQSGLSGTAAQGMEALLLQQQGYTVREIALHKNASPGQVSVWLCRAKVKLRSALELPGAA